MSDASKVKCPGCNKFVLKKIIFATHGKCNNCGYTIAGSITSFLSKPKSVLDLGSGVSF